MRGMAERWLEPVWMGLMLGLSMTGIPLLLGACPGTLTMGEPVPMQEPEPTPCLLPRCGEGRR